MNTTIQTGPVHHLALTVTDLRRSIDFYTSLLGFQAVMEFGARVLLANSSIVLAITPPPDASQALPGDCFNENRVGLDHLSFSVASMADLEAAVQLFDACNVLRGEIKPLDGLGIAVLAFRDPDNIQIELTAPLGQTTS